jgi:spore coat protein H
VLVSLLMPSARVHYPKWLQALRTRRGLAWLAYPIAGLLSVLPVSCGRHETSAPEATDSNEKAQSAAAVSVEDIGTEKRLAESQVQNLPRYELHIAAADLDALENNPGSNDTHPATFKAGGKVYNGVKVRVRGSWSRTWPKKSFKILFDHGAPFEGQRSINLNSGWRDPAFVREPLAYYVYEVCGVPAPRSRMVRLDVNGRFGGLYVQVEQPGKEFLSRVGLAGASVYKAGSRGRDADERDLGSEEAYRACYSKETQKTESFTELQQFCHDLDTAADKLDFFKRHVDLERYVNYLAATALIQHWDGFNKNHLLVHDTRGSQKWMVIPWDLDRTFGDHWNGSFTETRLPLLLGTRNLPGVTGWNRLEDKFCREPALRIRLLNRLAELLDKEFTQEKMFPVLERLEKEIASDAPRDRSKWPGANPDIHSEIAHLKTFIEQRRKFLLRETERLRANPSEQRAR